jgi:hypothetical protein
MAVALVHLLNLSLVVLSHSQNAVAMLQTLSEVQSHSRKRATAAHLQRCNQQAGAHVHSLAVPEAQLTVER